ncbi:MAG: pseudouridine synthase [Candidatus Methanomethylophilaceae archaeon]|nr:pseudouridine synthase [Candidatus Methanomethylophilaceae archaeon]
MADGEPIRINKYLADCGVCSMRQADELVAQGRVTVDGETAVTGTKVTPAQEVQVDGKSIKDDGKTIVLLLNKPVGIVCTTAEDEKDNVVKYVNYKRRIYPVGRLDKDSKGLLILTNRGDLVNGIMRSRYDHEKEYVVTVHRPVTQKFLDGMSAGVPILGTKTKPCVTEKLSKYRFRIVITEGLNRQIRRMCEHFGYVVTDLKRVRILDINLGDIPEGKWRQATKNEVYSLLKYAGLK